MADPRIKIINQENAGVSAARNRGVLEASSDFIAFLDADDTWDADHLEALIALRRKFPEVSLYSTDNTARRRKFSDRMRRHGIKLETQILLNLFEVCLRTERGWPHSSSFAVKKNAMLEAGGYNCNFINAEDAEFYARIAFRDPMVAFTLNGLSHFRIEYSGLMDTTISSEASISSEVSLNKHAMYMPRDIHDNTASVNNASFFFSVQPYLQSASPDVIAYLWFLQFGMASALTKYGRKLDAISYLIRCYRFYNCVPRDKLFFIKKICRFLCICLVPKILQAPARNLKLKLTTLSYRAK
jgi:glycosyltransferase involved in cell wall biosynthesis